MKKWVFTLLAFLYLMVTKADHYAGAELTYECISTSGSTSDYIIKLTVYRDCSGEELNDFYDVIYQSLSCGVGQTPLRLYATGPAVEITSLCPGQVSRCSGEGNLILGKQKREYSDTITLSHCSDWHFFWKNQNRNSLALTNILSVGSLQFQAIYVDLEFDNSVHFCDDFFEFPTNMMYQNICVEDTFVYNFKATLTNPDGDSVYFRLVPPKVDNLGGVVAYNSPFTFNTPITSNNGFNLDPNTGILTFAPTGPQLESSIIAVEVQEFKGGTLIASTVLDMQILVEYCTNVRPQLSGIDGSLEDTITMCYGQRNCFNINGTDANNDSMFISLLAKELPGIAVKIKDNGTSQAYASICWIPDSAGIFEVTLAISDNHCPVQLSNQKTIYINVPNDSAFQCECSSVDFDYDHICFNDYTDFDGKATLSIGTNVTNWLWDFGDSNFSTDPNPSHQYGSPGDYNVTVTFTDDSGCTKSTTKMIRICTPPTMDISHEGYCEAPASVLFIDNSIFDCNIIDKVWSYGDGKFGSSNVHKYIDTGWYKVNLTLVYGIDTVTPCYAHVMDSLYIHPKPEFELFPEDSFYQSCDPSYDTTFYIELVDTSNKVEWYVNKGFVFNLNGGSDDTLTFSTEDLTLHKIKKRDISVSVKVTDSIGCFNVKKRIILDPVLPKFLNTPYCEPGDTIIFYDLSEIDPNSLYYDQVFREFSFNDPYNVGATSTDSVAKYFYSSEGVYYPHLYVQDADSCFDFTMRTINISLPDSQFSVLSTTGGNDTVCFDDMDILFEGPNQNFATIDKYVWYIEDSEVDSVIIQNTYMGTWVHTIYGSNSTRTSIDGNKMLHRYDSLDFGTKHIHLKVIYNSIRNNNDVVLSHAPFICERHYYDTIDLRPPHNIDISYEGECLKSIFDFKAKHDPLGDHIVDWTWDLGDEFKDLLLGIDTVYNENDSVYIASSLDSSNQSYTYTYYDFPDRGFRTVSVTITDDYHCDFTEKIKIRAYRMDTLSIDPEGHCTNDIISFPPATFDRWQNIDLFRWNFGDPTTLADTALVVRDDSTLSWEFPNEGWYEVTLVISGNTHSCRDTISDSIFVDASPTAIVFQLDSTCIGETTFFIDHSVTNGVVKPDTLISWEYIIDDSTYVLTGNGNFDYTFLDEGYTDSIIFRAISSNGCFDETITQVYIAPKPKADFDFIPQLPAVGDLVTFTNRVNWFGENPDDELGYGWFLYSSDNELIITDTDGSLYQYDYQFEEEGIYLMKLIAENENQCKDTIIKEIDTYAYLDFPDAFSPAFGGDERNNTFRLYHKGIKEIVEYKIYNRFGQLVFDGLENGGINAEWDGTVNGSPQELGSFVVIVNAVDVMGRQINKKKNLMLVR